MDAIKKARIIEELEVIRETLGKLMHDDLPRMAVSGALEARLTTLWVKTSLLQGGMNTRGVVSGYRQDALAQVGRVGELLYDLGLDPDDQQLTMLGYACDLAAVKIKTCLRFASLSAKAEEAVSAGVTEEV